MGIQVDFAHNQHEETFLRETFHDVLDQKISFQKKVKQVEKVESAFVKILD